MRNDAILPPTLSSDRTGGEPSQTEEDDGRLEVHEIYGLDLSATDLVVLSACETNVGTLSAGDEVVGLTRSFHFAGSPTVIATLWVTDDAATGTLMVAFYRNLSDGMGKAEALHAAQAEVRETPRWRSPFYWAGFVLSGDPGQWTGQAAPGRAIPMLWLALAAALLVGGGVVVAVVLWRRKILGA